MYDGDVMWRALFHKLSDSWMLYECLTIDLTFDRRLCTRPSTVHMLGHFRSHVAKEVQSKHMFLVSYKANSLSCLSSSH